MKFNMSECKIIIIVVIIRTLIMIIITNQDNKINLKISIKKDQN